MVGPVSCYLEPDTRDPALTRIPQFGIELHTPGAGYAWLKMTKSLAEITELPPLAREVAILVTGNHEAAAYEVYAHSALSRLRDDDLKAIAGGRCPGHLDEKCHAAFNLATELCKPGRLSDEAWENAVARLGKTAAVAAVHYIGFYKYVATILNGFDAKVPENF